MTAIDRFAVGQVYTFRTVIDQDRIEQFAHFSGDENPIHLQAAEAKAYGYPRQVAHGAILVSLISRAIGMEIPGPGAVWMSQSIDWLNPVFVGDEVQLTVRVIEVSTGARQLTLETTATNQKGMTVMNGKATVKVSTKLDSPPRRDSTSPRIALITGGSRGIGAEIARTLASQGYRVAITYRESKAQAQALVQEIQKQGGHADLLSADLSDPTQASRLVEHVQEKWRGLDIVIHGASPIVKPIKISDLQYAEVEPFLKTYIGTGLALVRAATPQMITNKFGRFIFIGTSFLFGAPLNGIAPYVIAKEALWGLVKSLATELGPSGITSNLVSPGMTVTDFTADIPLRFKEIEARKSPMRRLATVEDTARLVAFLASPAANYINGANLPITGGPI